MKKITAIVLLIVLCFSLFGCTASDYSYAMKLYEEGDYENALVFFEATVKYKDSEEKLTECKYYLAKLAMENEEWADAASYLVGLDYEDSEDLLKECYMHTNLDYAFIADVEALVDFKLYQAEEQEVSQKDLARTEYSTIVKYELETFYDEDLKEISLELTEGLKLQVQALDENQLSESQSKLYQAEYMICDSLTALYENYDFFKGDESFKSAYVDVKDDYKKQADASVSIQEDLNSQFGRLSTTTGTPFKKENNYLRLTITNNSEYQYTLTIGVNFIDSTGVTYESTEVSHIMKVGETYKFSFRINSTSLFSTLSYDYSYKDII